MVALILHGDIGKRLLLVVLELLQLTVNSLILASSDFSKKKNAAAAQRRLSYTEGTTGILVVLGSTYK